MYRDVLNRSEVTKSTKWLDIRGNHDSFMDSDPESNKSFYRIYSEQGPLNPSSYRYQLTTIDNDLYSFIAMDFTPRPGPGRPFNFLGQISQKELTKIEEYLKLSENSTSIISFGHYPLSLTRSNRLKEIMKKVLVYLNGHLHLLFGRLYFRHFDGLLELELADWKDNRRFRLITIDAGLLSFGDFHFNQSIYAVLTNPKPVRIQSNREPLQRIEQSSHIRILIFSKANLFRVRVFIDSKFISDAQQSKDSLHLFVLPWNSSIYRDGQIHRIFIEILDDQNRLETIDEEFSVTPNVENRWSEIFSNNLILIVDWPKMGLIVICSCLMINVLSLIFFRYRAKRMKENYSICFSIWNKIRQRMFVLCSIDSMFYSLFTLSIYHLIGPWYIGYLSDGLFGFVFLWGIVIGQHSIPFDMQVYTGTIQILFFLIPLTLCLSSSAFYRFNELQSSSNLSESRFDRCLRLFSVYILLVYSLIFFFQWSFAATASYKYAWILSPFGIPLSIFSLFLYWKTRRLKIEEFHLESLMINNQEKSKSIRRNPTGKEN